MLRPIFKLLPVFVIQLICQHTKKFEKFDDPKTGIYCVPFENVVIYTDLNWPLKGEQDSGVTIT